MYKYDHEANRRNRNKKRLRGRLKYYSTITSVFPGFRFEELESLDYRSLILIYREAQRKYIEKSLNTLSLMRASQIKKEDYLSIVTEMKSQMNNIQKGVKELINENWNSLKKRN